MSSAIDRVIAELDAFTGEEVVALNLECAAELKLACRVDTGWARNNFQSTIGAPAPAEAAMSDAQAIRVLAGYTIEQGPTYVSNRVRYVGLQGKGRGALTIDEASEAVARALANRTAAGAKP